MKQRGRPRTGPSSAEILRAIRQTGGTSTLAGLGDRLRATPDVLRPRLAELTRESLLAKVAQGLYQLPPGELSLPAAGRRALEVLQAVDVDGHLTGLAPLLPFTQQFVRQFPQLIYADPRVIDVVEDELAAAGFVVARLGAGQAIPVVGDPGDLALLRSQSNPAQYGLRGHLASPEKAWVDLLRETHRGQAPMQLMELGAILRNLLESEVDLRRLRNYARKMGYVSWIDHALGDEAPSNDAQLEALKAGFES